jgi:hypothetical protein
MLGAEKATKAPEGTADHGARTVAVIGGTLG